MALALPPIWPPTRARFNGGWVFPLIGVERFLMCRKVHDGLRPLVVIAWQACPLGHDTSLGPGWYGARYGEIQNEPLPYGDLIKIVIIHW